MKPLGIRKRILLAALAPATVVAILVPGTLIFEYARQAESEQHRRLSAVARQLASAAEFSIFVGNREGLQRLADAAITEADIVAAAFLDQRGALLASTLPPEKLPQMSAVHEGFTAPPVTDDALHWHALPIRPASIGERDLFAGNADSEAPPLGLLLIQVSDKSLHTAMLDYGVRATLLSMLVMVFGMLLALVLSRSLIDMLLRIRKVVDQVGRGIRGARIERTSADELGQLANGINRMAARVEVSRAELLARVDRATRALRKEKEEAEEAAHSRSRFFAAASHDLRQPLHALGLSVTHLASDARHSSLLPGVKLLAHSVHDLQRLLDTLLDYSRLSGQVCHVDMQPVSAARAIASVHAALAALAADKGIALRQHAGQRCWLLTDPTLLHRILINLVSNAIRATNRGGVLIACRRRAGHAWIEVWDTGSGIPTKQQGAIFEELVQLDNPERNPDKGLGLGLAIVRRSADLLGHRIALCSRVGHGSYFAIEIPLADAPAQPQNREGNDKWTLLLAAASPQREELLDLLNGWSYAPIPAATASTAVDLIARHGAPMLVLCEVAADQHAALETLGRLDSAAGAPLPALLIYSGSLPRLDSTDQRLALTRPFRPARLRALIDHLVWPDDSDG